MTNPGDVGEALKAFNRIIEYNVKPQDFKIRNNQRYADDVKIVEAALSRQAVEPTCKDCLQVELARPEPIPGLAEAIMLLESDPYSDKRENIIAARCMQIVLEAAKRFKAICDGKT